MRPLGDAFPSAADKTEANGYTVAIRLLSFFFFREASRSAIFFSVSKYKFLRCSELTDVFRKSLLRQ